MTDVILHVYDVTNSGSDKTNNTIMQINKIFKDGIGLGGIFHSAVQVPHSSPLLLSTLLHYLHFIFLLLNRLLPVGFNLIFSLIISLWARSRALPCVLGLKQVFAAILGFSPSVQLVVCLSSFVGGCLVGRGT